MKTFAIIAALTLASPLAAFAQPQDRVTHTVTHQETRSGPVAEHVVIRPVAHHRVRHHHHHHIVRQVVSRGHGPIGATTTVRTTTTDRR